jgi:hypothetical protein
MSTLDPGWYTDPTDVLQQRYWDGSIWTSDSRDFPPSPDTPMYLGDPAFAGQAPASPHWVLSVVALILCFPVGLIALVYSIMSDSATASGNESLATKYSRYAKRLAVAAIAVAAFALGITLSVFGVTTVRPASSGQLAANETSALASVGAAYYNASLSDQATPVTVAEVAEFNSSAGTVSESRFGVVKFTFASSAPVCVTLPLPTSKQGPELTNC